jgi:inward rectifier potassium channel
MATIGYGFMAPGSNAANTIVAIESATGLILVALMSGLFFGKFSQAKARLRFTQKMLIINYYGKKTLTFRMANDRGNRIFDAKIRLTLLRPDKSPEGMRMRRFYELPLELSHPPLFSLSLTAMHVIPNFELDGLSVKEMCENNYEFFVTLIGTDGTFGQTIHATKIYKAEDIVSEGSWLDIVEFLPDGTRVLDFKNFDVINPI